MIRSIPPHRRLGARRSFLFLLTLSLTLVALLSIIRSRAFSPMPLGNYADTAVQLGANTTITPDAAPTGTTSINVATSTNFKGRLEGNPTTGVVRVTDAHPAGIYTVAVTAFDGGPSTKTFILTVTTPLVTCNPVTFATATNFGLGTTPLSVAVGDFNGDGKQDLAVANDGSNNVSVLLGNGAGSFGAATNFNVGSGPFSVAVGDFNGDGKQDLAVANDGSNNVSVLLGNGAGSFSAATNFGVGFNPNSVAVGDFNGDGKQDLAVANFSSDNVSVLLGDGAGNFGAATNFGVGSNPRSVAIGDFNGDGKQDLATGNQSTSDVSILLGNGAGGFSAATNFGVGTQPRAVAVGDFNGDGKQDLAVANTGDAKVSVLLGNGAGGFGAAANFNVGSGPTSVAVGDFNGDGRQDLAVANNGSNNVSVLLGAAAGGFSAALNFAVDTGPVSVAVGDFDGDGKQDLATANDGSNNLSVLLRQCPPLIVSNTNDSGAGSLRQAILDANSTPGANTVAFNIPNADPGFNGAVFTIKPLSSLPAISDAGTTIDGATQTAFTGNTNTGGPEVVLNGSLTGAGAFGLNINASNCVVKDLVINGFSADGVTLFAPTNSSISGNIVQGCYIGTNASGTAAVGNGNSGVSITAANGAPGNITASNNTIGGTTAAARNVISGNAGAGVLLNNSATGNFVQGNFIGTNAAGTGAIPNVQNGVEIGPFGNPSDNNTVGGSTAGAGNVISGNTSNGVSISSSANSIIQGNFIGTNAAGTTSLANGGHGVTVTASVLTMIFANVISGNGGNGVTIQNTATGTIVQGNFIGTNAGGTATLGNGNNGVFINSSTGNVVGGPSTTGNVIFNNAFSGVSISGPGTINNAILSNTIGNNGGSGISLIGGGNNNQAPPVLTSVSSSGGFISIQGSATGPPNTTGIVQFFANDACDPSGSGEGQIFLGSLDADFGANGSTSGNPDPLPGTVAPGKFLTATTTDANNNTSAFSICRVVTNSSFNISGRVLDSSGNPISGLSVDLNGAVQANTDASGNYVFGSIAAGGNYIVTPSNTNYSFTPPDQTFTNLGANRIANFVGTQTIVNITGKVTDSNNVGINNVTVHLTRNGSEAVGGTTDGLGNYAINNLAAGADYVVTPTGTFAPSSQTFSNLTLNATANFKAAPSIPSQCNTASLAAANNFPAGSGPTSVAVADFNGDGKLDLAVANIISNNVSILLGTGTGGFGAATNFATGTSPRSVAVGDFNGDGKLDLALANQSSANVSILLGTGTGSFGTATNFAADSGSFAVAVGDFNGDGKLDLAVANATSGDVSILLGTGTGSFSAATNFAVGSSPFFVAVGDFNGDGKLDLAVATNSANISILLGTGTGSFGAPANFAVGVACTAVAVSDLNGDGKLDLAVTNQGSNDVSILLGTGAGTFSAATSFGVGASPFSIAVGDFNGDGKLDLAVPSFGANNVSILLGTGTGSFGAATNFAAGSGSIAVAVSDFNGDGKLDLAVANQASNDVSVLLNNGAICNTQTSLSISGQVKDAKNNPLPDVTVTLSGTITRVVQTDINGNYAFSNLTPGGNYSVTLQSNYFVFAASRSDFFNLSSNQTPNFVAAPVAAPSPTPPLSDDFGSFVRDPNKWNLGTLTLPPGAIDPAVTTAQINGQLVITPLTQAAGMHYDGYVSANSFDLRNGKASVELVKAAAGGADTIFGIGSDSDNFARFVVHTPGAPSALITTKAGEGIEAPVDATTALLVFQVKVGGQLTALSIPYDPVQHRFMRFRHVPAINSIVFETSPDDVNYTVQQTVVLQKGVSALTAELTAGTSNPANPGAAVFDNFSLVTSTFQFSATNYTVGEGAGSISITVTRSGSTTSAASVDFATADGTAQQRTKYINAAGRLTFATGETSKTFDVLIEDNAQAEGDETVNLLLMNPVGSGLNSPARALLNIIDNDTIVATGNPLDDPVYFTTQHYYDFLNRAPDSGGLGFWVGTITACGADPTCIKNKRVDLSNAFFYELEFQQTGAYVFRVDRIAFGNHQPFPNPFPDPNFPGEAEKLVSYTSFAADRARVVGGSTLAQAQSDFANTFVQRPEFLTKYPVSLSTAAQFVDAVLATIQSDLGVNLSSERSALITLFNSGGRGAVLYRLADDNVQTNPINNRPLIDAEYTRTFVATQYFGYLRRDADIGGFLFWLGQVSSAPPRDVPKQHAMVCSFITSDEYQQRFSLVATHHNNECPH